MTELSDSEKFSNSRSSKKNQAASYRLQRWQEGEQWQQNEALPDIRENLPSGTDLPRKDWISLNRARVKVGKTKDNSYKWGFTTNPECPCGAASQTMEHILRHCPLGPHCSDQDLKEANNTAQEWVRHWRDKI